MAAGPIFVLPIIKYWMKDTNMQVTTDIPINGVASDSLENIATTTAVAPADETKGRINQEAKA